ncbi:hypothetical protein QTA58_19545 [Neorhizobium sp. CSC1952]|uniref:hypothetical protein n=1 Tax=Neorhizobium sp. CSC1952 TaxID=2978974 RepID=UPI0025A5F3D2|nr:hypothetical protein [Rhizobium sp. CSC1952]WJR66392.1 hypothetical protein QTA58_19545 [Rhizobium sp. CSC1952]
MARRSAFDIAFHDLRTEFNPTSKRAAFLDDIKWQLEEDPDIYDIVRKRRSSIQYLAVSFDRKVNDVGFSYGDLDLVLVALDAAAGGSGIRKPVNQMRVLRWNSTKRDLRRVLQYLAKLNPQIRTRSMLILPFPMPVVGRGLVSTIYKS